MNFNKYYVLIIFLIFGIYLLINYATKKNNVNIDNNSLINPDNLQKKMRQNMMSYFRKFLDDTKNNWNYILPTELNKENLSKYYLLDIRKKVDFNKGHIAGSKNIFWKNLMLPQNINKIPKNKEIILICYVGHTSSQILVMLKLLGYKVRVLKFGLGESPSVGVPVAGWKNYGFKIGKT